MDTVTNSLTFSLIPSTITVKTSDKYLELPYTSLDDARRAVAGFIRSAGQAPLFGGNDYGAEVSLGCGASMLLSTKDMEHFTVTFSRLGYAADTIVVSDASVDWLCGLERFLRGAAKS